MPLNEAQLQAARGHVRNVIIGLYGIGGVDILQPVLEMALDICCSIGPADSTKPFPAEYARLRDAALAAVAAYKAAMGPGIIVAPANVLPLNGKRGPQ